MKATIESIVNWIKENKTFGVEKKKFSSDERKELLVTMLNNTFPGRVVSCNFEKPATGRVFGVKEMKDRYRINYRCGYGRWNYAPCVEVLKQLNNYRYD